MFLVLLSSWHYDDNLICFKNVNYRHPAKNRFYCSIVRLIKKKLKKNLVKNLKDNWKDKNFFKE